MKKSGTNWNSDEIEVIVADYLDMLKIELSGKNFNKAERNRALQERIDRSKGSIEYKHQNISAVMAMLGLPFIWGYKPARNFQRQLFEILERHLIDGNLVSSISNAIGGAVVPSTGLTFQTAPSQSSKRNTEDPIIRRILHKFDPAARDARARDLGEAGEKFLFHAERNRLSAVGRDDLSEMVRWVSKEDGDGAGFDILSFSITGIERWIEVKTTNGPSTTPFWISENERRVSEERRDVFRLARLYDFSKLPAGYKLRPPLTDHVNLSAVQYIATL